MWSGQGFAAPRDPRGAARSEREIDMNHRRSIAASLVTLAGLAILGAFAWQQEAWKTPPAMQHATEGRDNCMMCHKAGTMEAVPDAPASHADWPNDICADCHAKDATVQTTAPPAITHPMEGRAACTMCHEAGKMEAVPDMPADHEGRVDKYCTVCHTAPA